MREIEFRGKDKSTGKWVYGDLTHTMGVTDTGLRPRVMVGGYEVYEDSVGELVKNYGGKKYYEGDIAVTTDEKPLTVVLVKTEKNAMFVWLTKEEYENYIKNWWVDLDHVLFWTYAFDDETANEIKVVGNVFDNKELLK